MSALPTIDWGRLGEDAQGLSVFDDLTAAGKNLVRLHAEVVHLLAAAQVGQVPSRQAFFPLVRACGAMRVALGLAIAEASRENDRFDDLVAESGQGLRALAAEEQEPELQVLLDQIARRIGRLNEGFAREKARSAHQQPGPAFAEYIGATVVLDALILLLAISRPHSQPLAGWRIEMARGALHLVGHSEVLVSDTPHAVLIPSLGPPGDRPVLDAASTPWTGLPVDVLLEAIRLAFASERIQECRQLIDLGLAWFPGHVALIEARSTFGPPVTSSRPRTADADARRRSREWLRDNAAKHSGEWVAVLDGTLLCAAADLSEIRSHVGELAPDTLLVRVQ